MSISEDAKKPCIPLPKLGDLVERELRHPKKDKWELTGYKFKMRLNIPHFGFLIKILPDLLAQKHEFVPPEIERPDKFQDALKSHKLAWLSTIKNLNFPKNEIPPAIIPDAYKKDENHRELYAKTAQPLIIGLGEASPYETGITLDFLTGLPVIPGSALKGITRRAAILNLAWENRNQIGAEFKEKFGFELQPFENTQYSDLLPYGKEFDFVAQKIENELEPDEFIKVFGTQELKGKVIFMDAYPVDWSGAPDGKLFRVDVMNPHYGPYYESNGGRPPGDWYNPVPVFYLTVNEDVKYRFIIASKDKNILSTAREWLEFALENIGVGAKGNQGYGVFKALKSN